MPPTVERLRRPEMKEKAEQAVTDRRGFLKLAGLGTVAGGAALVASSPQSEAGEATSDGKKLYRETAHVKRYYDLARF